MTSVPSTSPVTALPSGREARRSTPLHARRAADGRAGRRGSRRTVISILGVGGSLYGARSELRLATRTPEEIAPEQHLGPDRGAADVARRSGTTVDVDLAPVVVDARRATHRRRRVLGTHRVDAAGADALGHQDDQV